MSVDQFPIAAAQLVGIICEAILYGSYIVTCWFCARTLLFKVDNQKLRLVRLDEVRWLLTIISVMFFTVSTWDMATGILHLFNAFIKAENPAAEFDRESDWINIARALNQYLTVLLGDFVLIYRCWIVYGRRWLVITPSVILYLGAAAMAIKMMEIETNLEAKKSMTMAICPWSTTMFGLNAFQNLLTSGMLVWRIWRIGRQVDKYTVHLGEREANSPRPTQKFMRAIVESGAVYTTAGLATFLVSASGSNAIFIAADISLQTAGIVFNIIVVRSIERDDQDVCIQVADTQNGPPIPMFLHAAQDASIESNQSQESKQYLSALV